MADGGTKVCLNGLGHMTRMAAMPIFGIKPLNQKVDDFGTWCVASGM